jgi:hypothetical protein
VATVTDAEPAVPAATPAPAASPAPAPVSVDETAPDADIVTA